MSTSLIPDPMQMWRDALTQLESNVNALVTGSMDSKEVVRSVHQLSTVSLGLQQAFEKAIGSYLARVNLPSRKDVADLAAALQRLEDKVDSLVAANGGSAPVRRPPRTRRPAEAASAPAAASALPASSAPTPAPAAKTASATRGQKTAKRAPARSRRS